MTIQRDTLMLYPPNTEYWEYESTNQRIEEAFVLFHVEPGVDRRLRRLTLDRGFGLTADPEHRVIDPLLDLARQYQHRAWGWDLVARGLLLQSLGRLLAMSEINPATPSTDTPSNSDDDFMAAIHQVLDRHVDRPVSVEKLAGELGVSGSTLARRLQFLTGQTPHRFVLQWKIQLAKIMMLHDGLNVAQTADALGFSSPFNFSRAFKRIEGVPPSNLEPTRSRRRTDFPNAAGQSVDAPG